MQRSHLADMLHVDLSTQRTNTGATNNISVGCITLKCASCRVATIGL